MKTAKSSRPRVLLIHRSIVINPKGQLLFIQRSQNDGWLPLYWEVPGGKVDEGQNLSDSLEREVFEETGILITPTHRLGYFESSTASSPKYKGMLCVSIIAISTCTKSKVTLSSEHQHYQWLNLKEALRLPNITPQVQKAILVLKKEINALVKPSKRAIIPPYQRQQVQK